jgi:hypothetical protein
MKNAVSVSYLRDEIQTLDMIDTKQVFMTTLTLKSLGKCLDSILK